jgi:catechol 2,3-dioxygenase-like lactoylglutathione lyase family enzyme
MKQITFSFLILLFLISSYQVTAQSEFSSATIEIGVVVSDIGKSLDFYTNVIGMRKVGEFDVDEEFGKISGLTGGVPFHVDVLKLEDSPGATQWKLMSFEKDAAHPLSKYIQDDTGVQYITINVTSLKPFLERIKKHHIKLLGDTPVPLGPDNHFVLVSGPDGTIIELIGPLE